jgi:hypothetical protein
MRDKVEFALFFIGLGLCVMGVYDHFVTVADIPSPSMTLPLEWSGWEWDAAGLASFFLCWMVFSTK